MQHARNDEERETGWMSLNSTMFRTLGLGTLCRVGPKQNVRPIMVYCDLHGECTVRSGQRPLCSGDMCLLLGKVSNILTKDGYVLVDSRSVLIVVSAFGIVRVNASDLQVQCE